MISDIKNRVNVDLGDEQEDVCFWSEINTGKGWEMKTERHQIILNRGIQSLITVSLPSPESMPPSPYTGQLSFLPDL